MPHTSIALPLPAELEILEILWWRKATTAKELYHELATQRIISYRTVKTTLAIMQAKGLVLRSQLQHPYLYQATHTRSELQNLVLTHLARTLFHDDMSSLLRTVLIHPKLQLEKDRLTAPFDHKPIN
jgi:predicted transcriptional regulator